MTARRTRYNIDGKPFTIVETVIRDRLTQGYSKGGDYADGVARIDPRQPSRSRRYAKLHELLHHIAERSSLSAALGRKNEELVCEEVALWLITVGDSAPELVREIFDL